MSSDLPLAKGRLSENLLLASRVISILVAILACIVLLGWWLHVPLLIQLSPNWVSMKINTALSLLVGACLLWNSPGQNTQSSVLATGCSLFLLMVAGLTLSEYLFSSNWSIDQFLVTDWSISADPLHPGRMALTTALSFLLLGISFLLLRSRSGIARNGAQFAALLVLLLMGAVFMSSLLGVSQFVGLAFYTKVTVSAALGLFLLAIGLLCSSAESGFMRTLSGSLPGSRIARRLLPVIIVVPVLVGWLRWLGEDHGLYDSTMGTSLMILFTVMLLFAAVLWGARSTNEQMSQSTEHDQLLHSILDSISDGLLVVDASAKMRLYNRAASEITGVGMQEGPPSEWEQAYGVFEPDGVTPIPYERFPLVRALKGEACNDVEQYLRNSGKPEGVYIMCAARPIYDEQRTISGAVVVFQDITERKRREQQLQRVHYGEQSLAQLLALYNDTTDREHILQQLLNVLAERHDYPVSVYFAVDEWSNSLTCCASHGAPAAMKTSLASQHGLIAEALRSGKTQQLNVWPGATIDAVLCSLVPRAVLLAPVHYQDKPLGVLVLCTTQLPDVQDLQLLDRLCAQLAVALHNRSLYQDLQMLAGELRRRSEEVQTKNIELESANRMKTEFLSNMSHELRTPLNAIIGFAEALRDGLTGPLIATQIDATDEIAQAGHHLLSLINDLLDLSKIEAGRMVLETSELEVKPLLEQALTIVREMAASRRVSLRLDCAADVITVVGDSRRLKQVLFNLLSNAVKFTPNNGEVCLSAERVKGYQANRARANTRIALAVTQSDTDYLAITVSDTGIGINSADMQRLFEPFVQIEGDYARHFEGTGLGLSMVRRLMHMHGGGVAVESLPGAGSRFTVYLPLNVPCSVEVVPILPLNEAHADLRALVVEDDPGAANLIKECLMAEGLSVLIVSSVAEALKALQQTAYDLITLDILLPDGDGWSLLQQIRAHPTATTTPVVIISMVDQLPRGMSLGASAILSKPFTRDELRQVLDRLGLSDRNGARILVVDDEPFAVTKVATQLEQWGFTVARALSGKEALEDVDKRIPDLILLDLMMPDMNGFQVIDALRASPRSNNIPIVVLTGKDLLPEERTELSRQVQQVVSKADFSAQSFRREVWSALGKQQTV